MCSLQSVCTWCISLTHINLHKNRAREHQVYFQQPKREREETAEEYVQGKAVVNTGAAWALHWSTKKQAAASSQRKAGSVKPGLVKV